MQHWNLTAAIGTGLAAAVLTGAAAHASGIAVTVERTAEADVVREGETVEYAITVANTGEESYEDLRVSHLLPAGFTLAAAEPATETDGGAAWRISIGPGETVELGDTVEAGTGEQLQEGRLVVVEQPDLGAAGDGTGFTTTVCVATADEVHMLDCASDQAALVAPAEGGAHWWLWAAAAGAAGVLAVGLWVLLTRSRGARA
ncbi:hypothetical protein [Glycomyces sp. NPDC047010]|uniref:hypothetical protein n=1 Tax=Glycomyces sp. NPDC047010 TaxID=3155023 RepID=UPI00340CAA6C